MVILLRTSIFGVPIVSHCCLTPNLDRWKLTLCSSTKTFQDQLLARVASDVLGLDFLMVGSMLLASLSRAGRLIWALRVELRLAWLGMRRADPPHISKNRLSLRLRIHSDSIVVYTAWIGDYVSKHTHRNLDNSGRQLWNHVLPPKIEV